VGCSAAAIVVDVIRLRNGYISVGVDALHGGRLSSLQIGKHELLIQQTAHTNPREWGCYPMSPWAGRVRNGAFTHNESSHQLPINAPPHSLHGTVLDVKWQIEEHSDTHAVLRTTFDQRWPFGGRIEQRIDVSESSVLLTLTAFAEREDMPIQVGWHPWFVKPIALDAPFAHMLLRDDEGITTTEIIQTSFASSHEGITDDCFIAESISPVLSFSDGIQLSLASDCSHWVVYDKPAHATCVEPQSGPPDAINTCPTVIAQGQSLSRWFRLTVAGYRQVE